MKFARLTAAIGGVALGSLGLFAQDKPAAANAPKFHINSQRLQSTLEKLSEFGRNPDGGVARRRSTRSQVDAA